MADTSVEMNRCWHGWYGFLSFSAVWESKKRESTSKENWTPEPPPKREWSGRESKADLWDRRELWSIRGEKKENEPTSRRQLYWTLV